MTTFDEIIKVLHEGSYVCECDGPLHTLNMSHEEYTEASQGDVFVCNAKCEYAQKQIEIGEMEIILEQPRYIVLVKAQTLILD